MPADHKPPFPISPIRVRHRSVLRASVSNAPSQSQIGSASKPKSLTRSMNLERSELQSEYETISSEFMELTKDKNGKPDSCNFAVPEKSKLKSKSKSSPLFERGRFYDEYSARRNERLKRKKSGGEEGTACDLSFASEPVKKRNVKKFDDLNGSVSKTPLSEINESVNPVVPRYSLRSRTKDNKMPPLPPSSINPVRGRKQAPGGARKS